MAFSFGQSNKKEETPAVQMQVPSTPAAQTTTSNTGDTGQNTAGPNQQSSDIKKEQDTSQQVKKLDLPGKPDNKKISAEAQLGLANLFSQIFSGKITHTTIAIKLIMIFFCAILGFIFFYANWYFDQYAGKTIDPTAIANINTYQEYETQINSIIRFNNFEDYNNLPKSGPSARSTIQQVIEARDINYVHKKRILTETFANILNDTVRLDNEINGIKNQIGQYGFFAEELTNLLDLNENKISLQRSMLALETIKFSTSLKVYNLLETFVSQFGRLYNLDREDILTYMDFYGKRSETDIINYLTSCYLNPFEDPKTCTIVGDFEKYFEFYEPDTQINPTLFLQLMSFIDQKLSESTFPSFSITFDRFNPQAQALSFRVIVNTLQEDERALINEGILNPHIYVLTNVINQLKESKFIIGEDIIVNDMKINKQLVEVGGREITINNSSRTFNLPLQSNVQREIFDFIPPRRDEIRDLEDQIREINTVREPSLVLDQLDVDLELFGTINDSNQTGNTQTGNISSGTNTVIDDSIDDMLLDQLEGLFDNGSIEQSSGSTTTNETTGDNTEIITGSILEENGETITTATGTNQ